MARGRSDDEDEPETLFEVRRGSQTRRDNRDLRDLGSGQFFEWAIGAELNEGKAGGPLGEGENVTCPGTRRMERHAHADLLGPLARE